MDAPVDAIDLGAGDGFRWQVWVYGDGTAQLVRRWPDRTIVGTVGRRTEDEIRAAIAGRGISDEAWPD